MTSVDPFFDDTFWVVRSAGERTTDVCYALINAFIPKERIVVIRERPFTKAITASYHAALAADRKWTVIIDADVYVEQASFRELIAVADAEPLTTFNVQGLTIDKYIPIIRSAGTGVYRTRLLRKALRCVPKQTALLRPETVTVQNLLKKGYKMRRTPLIVGMHDFDQYYIDILRKAYLHSRKHPEVKVGMVDYWKAHQAGDKDFQAALLGHQLSEQHSKAPEVDHQFMREEYTQALLAAGLTEKAALPPTAVTPAEVTDYVRSFVPHAALQAKKFPQYKTAYYVNVSGTRRLRRVVRWRVAWRRRLGWY